VKSPLGPVSPLFTGAADLLREAARSGPVVDLACGRGRHALASASMGLPTVAIDRSSGFLSELGERAAREGLRIDRVRADLEAGHGLPLAAASCGAILVFRYLHRPLCPTIAEALVPGGLLLYETFTRDQLSLGSGPKSPRFLLAPGELPELFAGLEVLSYHEGLNPAVLHHGAQNDAGGQAESATARLATRAPAR